MTHTFTLTHSYHATPSAIYRAFTTPGGLTDWIAGYSDVDTRVGGRLFIWEEKGYQVMGKFTALEQDKLVAFDVLGPIASHVAVSISGDGAAATLTLEHSGLEKEEYVTGYQERWQNALTNLQSTLETGLDRRFYDRPMLGILIAGSVDAKNQERYRVPEGYGIIVNGTVPGMGAEKIGLIDEDVIVEMDNIQLTDYYALERAVSPHKAGDSVPVAWYRLGEKHRADLPLSGRPIPEIPPTPAELAEAARQLYARLDAELAEILDGATESEADYRPAETEWNAKEIIAHTIATERAAQIWIVNAAEGQVFNNWASNDHLLVKSIVDIHTTLPQLTDELHRAEGQTIALVQRLPATITQFKGAYHNIATNLGKHGLALHTRMHYDVIKNLLETARKQGVSS